jgi:hypothetical protein
VTNSKVEQSGSFIYLRNSVVKEAFIQGNEFYKAGSDQNLCTAHASTDSSGTWHFIGNKWYAPIQTAALATFNFGDFNFVGNLISPISTTAVADFILASGFNGRFIGNTIILNNTSGNMETLSLNNAADSVLVDGNTFICGTPSATSYAISSVSGAALVLGTNKFFNYTTDFNLSGDTYYMRTYVGDALGMMKFEAHTDIDSLDIITPTDTLRIPFFEYDK